MPEEKQFLADPPEGSVCVQNAENEKANPETPSIVGLVVFKNISNHVHFFMKMEKLNFNCTPQA